MAATNLLELLLEHYPQAKYNPSYNWYEFQDNSRINADGKPKDFAAFEEKAEDLFYRQLSLTSWDDKGACAIRINA